MKSRKKEFISLILAGMMTTVSCGSSPDIENPVDTEPVTTLPPPVILNPQEGSFMDTADDDIAQAENNREQSRNEVEAIEIMTTTTTTTSSTTTSTTTSTAYTADVYTTLSATTTTIPIINVSQTERGNIYDTNGVTLVKSGADGKRNYSEKYGTALGNILNEASGGIETSFDNILSAEDPYSSSASKRLGKSVKLTIDADVQNLPVQLIRLTYIQHYRLQLQQSRLLTSRRPKEVTFTIQTV